MSDPLREAQQRAHYRLTYDVTEDDRELHRFGIAGPDLPNSYYHMGGPTYRNGHGDTIERSETGSGDWEDTDHGDYETAQEHIDRWFATAIREAVHEACEWFWVDGKPLLDPHGMNEDVIHELSGEFAEQLLRLTREEGTP